MGRSQRAKGVRYEQKIARYYETMGFNAKRGDQRRYGDDAPDVVLDELPDLWIECSHRAGGGFAFRKWDQAVEAVGNERKNIVLHLHEDNGPDLVVVSAEFWKEILGRLMGEPNVAFCKAQEESGRRDGEDGPRAS